MRRKTESVKNCFISKKLKMKIKFFAMKYISKKTYNSIWLIVCHLITKIFLLCLVFVVFSTNTEKYNSPNIVHQSSLQCRNNTFKLLCQFNNNCFFIIVLILMFLYFTFHAFVGSGDGNIVTSVLISIFFIFYVFISSVTSSIFTIFVILSCIQVMLFFYVTIQK